MQQILFSQCTLTQLDKQFGLRKIFDNPQLDQWLRTEVAISDDERKMLKSYQELLILNTEGWNETELSLHFIGPMFNLVRFTEPYRYNLFSRRKISAVIDDIELYGEPDGIVATGYREPEIPYFAFTEYKRQLDPNGDPAGQTLAAMLAGQALNESKTPIYGCYVIGRDWNFMLLDGQHYCISRDYSALSDEVFDILRILKALKNIVIYLTSDATI